MGRRAADGTVREFALPEGSEPTGIAVARDGAAWVVERRGNRIVRITPEGEISVWPIATPNAQPDAVALAPDGSLWATLANVNRLLRGSRRTGTLKEYQVEGAPLRVAVGRKDGGRLVRRTRYQEALPARPGHEEDDVDGSSGSADGHRHRSRRFGLGRHLASGDKLAKVPPKS